MAGHQSVMVVVLNLLKSLEGGREGEGSMMMGLRHLLVTVFLYNFATFMVIPAITDVTMLALCPGKDKCSLAIYLTGFQQAVFSFLNFFPTNIAFSL